MQIGFVLHVLVEAPAGLNFLFRPDSQLAVPQPHAHPIIRQYALLLFSSCCVAGLSAIRPLDTDARRVAAALALYHLAPLVRATLRIAYPQTMRDRSLEPLTHATAHIACLITLMSHWSNLL